MPDPVNLADVLEDAEGVVEEQGPASGGEVGVGELVGAGDPAHQQAPAGRHRPRPRTDHRRLLGRGQPNDGDVRLVVPKGNGYTLARPKPRKTP